VLPDDWPNLAGPDWMAARIHWDIMDNPFDDIMSVTASEVGPYRTNGGFGNLVADAPVIGPFTPGWELPLPWGWWPFVTGWSYLGKTVVPNRVLEWWDAPMPPAKITFKIKSGPGFLKEADKGLIYYMRDPGGGVHYTNPFYKIMVPAHWKIPAFVNNGGYDWDSWGLYGPYDFWYIMNRPPNPQAPSHDYANYPTKVQVYSDNHGEAMVFLNGDYNLDLSRWLTDGAYDVPPDMEVGTTRVEAIADYPYFRKHPALISNPVEKTWTWGKRILGPDPANYPDGNMDAIETRMVFQVGTLLEGGLSTKKLVMVWVTDRDGIPVYGERIDWDIEAVSGAPSIPPGSFGGVSNYNEIMENIFVEDGFLAWTGGVKTDWPTNQHATSYTRYPTSWEMALFDKIFGEPDPSQFPLGYPAVAGLEILSSIPSQADLTIYFYEREGIIERHVNLDWSVADPPDDPVLLGDADMDGDVDMGDVTKIKRIIMDQDASTTNADADWNRVIDMGDVVKTKRTILGQ
jgi:hypothetical protein